MASPVASEWEKIEYIVAGAQKGDLVYYSNNKGEFTRRNVVNNADLLGPLIQVEGGSATLMCYPQLGNQPTSSLNTRSRAELRNAAHGVRCPETRG